MKIKFKIKEILPAIKIGDTVVMVKETLHETHNWFGNNAHLKVGQTFIVNDIIKSGNIKIGSWLYKNKNSIGMGISSELVKIIKKNKKE